MRRRVAPKVVLEAIAGGRFNNDNRCTPGRSIFERMKGHREARPSLLTDLLAIMSRKRIFLRNTVSSKQHYRDTCKPKASRGASTTIWSLLTVRQSTNGAKGRAPFVDLVSFSTDRNVEHSLVRRGFASKSSLMPLYYWNFVTVYLSNAIPPAWPQKWRVRGGNDAFLAPSSSWPQLFLFCFVASVARTPQNSHDLFFCDRGRTFSPTVNSITRRRMTNRTHHPSPDASAMHEKNRKAQRANA
jgi:hypothetical protein